MNETKALEYFARNGFVFVIYKYKIPENVMLINIAKFTNFEDARQFYHKYQNGVYEVYYSNLTKAKKFGWLD